MLLYYKNQYVHLKIIIPKAFFQYFDFHYGLGFTDLSSSPEWEPLTCDVTGQTKLR